MSLEEYYRELQMPDGPLDLTQENLCYLIRKFRRHNHWTQEEFGEKLGVKKSRIAKIENGRSEFKLSTLIAALDLLDLKLKFIVERK